MKWIRIEDEKPINNQHVIIYGKELHSPILIHYKEDSLTSNFFLMQLIGSWDVITHWMPLSQSPKE